jgi:hypothetical protein
MGMRWAFLCLGWGALAGCSGSSSSSVSADTAAQDVANAYCQKIDACADFFVRVAYGDATTCGARVKLSLTNALAAAGTGWTASNLESCAKAVPAASCDDLLGHNLPAACQPVPGTLATGKACSDSSQCTTAFCNIAGGQACGACAAPPIAGATCVSDDGCPAGAVCKGGTSAARTCVVPAATGAACGDTQPCRATVVCRAGVCSAPDGVGAACTVGGGTCNGLAGIYCPAAATCAQAGLAAPGGTCGVVDGGITVCSTSAQCTSALGGSCLAAAADGQLCDTTNGPGCMPPAVCQNGVCTLPDSNSCK